MKLIKVTWNDYDDELVTAATNIALRKDMGQYVLYSHGNMIPICISSDVYQEISQWLSSDSLLLEMEL